MTDDAFGFGASAKPKPTQTLADKLASVKPTADPKDEPTDRVDVVADKRGFVSREPPKIAGRQRKGTEGPFVAINTRAPVRVAEPFIAWCERERYSYWQGIEELMKRAGLV